MVFRRQYSPPPTIVVKGLSQICLHDTTKMFGSTDSNSGEWPQDFLCFSLTYYFIELVIFQVNISLYLYA